MEEWGMSLVMSQVSSQIANKDLIWRPPWSNLQQIEKRLRKARLLLIISKWSKNHNFVHTLFINETKLHGFFGIFFPLSHFYLFSVFNCNKTCEFGYHGERLAQGNDEVFPVSLHNLWNHKITTTAVQSWTGKSRRPRHKLALRY